MEYVRETVKQWEEEGVVEIVTLKPQAISPLTVASRILADGSVKQRLCFDGSRYINPRLAKKKVNLAHLQSALEITEKGDWQAVYDLSNAFFHIRICPDHQKFLGACFQDKDGSKHYFQFKVLPFGVATAVHAITKIFKPIQSYLGKQGIRHSIYIDDGRVVAESAEKARRDYTTVTTVLKKAGWQMAAAKSDTPETVAQEKTYLGFVINTKSMTVHLKEEKAEQLKQVARDMAASAGRFLKAKDLASMIGKVASAEPALGMFPAIMMRRAYAELEATVEEKGWASKIRIPPEVAEDFGSFGEQLEDFNGTPVRNQKTQISVVSIIGEPSQHIKQTFIDNHIRKGELTVWAGDASATAVCAFSVAGKQPFFFKKNLNQQERQQSSGFRELMTVKHTLIDMSERRRAEEGTTVYWLTDSENLVRFLTKGSGKKHVQEEVLLVLKIARQIGIELKPIHLLRSDPRIQQADAGSKSKNSDDWSIDAESFQQLEETFGPFSVDLFASDHNHRVEKFYAQFFSVKAAGVEALSQDWSGENAWVCPPVKHVISVIRKVKQESMTGVLIVPDWASARHRPFIFAREGELQQPFKEVIRFRPRLQQTAGGESALSGQPRFDMFAIYFDSR